MDLRKYILLAALPIAFTACQDEVLVENHDSKQGITTLFGIMDEGLSDSRAQIALGNTNSKSEKFMWNVGDKFTLFQTWQQGTESLLYSIHPFTISDDYTYEKYGAKGAFSTDEPLVDGKNYVAFYPTESLIGEEENPKGYVKFSISENVQDNTPESWVKYFNENMFMQSIGTVAEDKRDLSFNHLCGIIRITYTNATEEDHELKGIYVNGSLGVFRQYNLFEPNDNTGDGNSLRHGVEFTDKATVKAGESEDFYILFFPPTIYGDVTTIEPMTNIFVDYDVAGENNSLSSTPETYQGKTFSYNGFEAGKCYWFKIAGLDNEKLAWTKDMNGDEGGEDEGEILDRNQVSVSTFQELKDALAVKAKRNEITLTQSIALEEPLAVRESQVLLNMNGYSLTLGESYQNIGDSTAVFYIGSKLELVCGDLVGKEGNKIHDYYFKLGEGGSHLMFDGVNLITGNAITNAVYAEYGHFNVYTHQDYENPDNSKSSNIVTSGYAIYWDAKKAGPQNYSRINATINGNVKIVSTFETLNTYMIFESGKIDGDLDMEVPESLKLSDYIVYSYENVTIGATNKGWEQAGRYVEDINAFVTTEEELRAAIDKVQAAKELTSIYLRNDITLTSPLTIKKPVQLHLQEKTLSLSNNFSWGASDAAILVTSDATFGELKIYGRYNGSPIENVNGVITGSTTETGKYLIKSSSNELRLEDVDIIAKGSLNAICVENNQLYTQGKYSTKISAEENCYAINIINSTAENADICLLRETEIVGNIGFTLGNGFRSGIHDNTKSSTINGNLIVEGNMNSLSIDVNLDNVTGEGWPKDDAGGGDEGYDDIDPDAKSVGTLKELQDAFTWDGPIYLTADIELTAPLVVENIGKPIFMNGKTISMSSNFAWGDADAVITSNGAGLVILGGTLKGPETDQEIDKSFFKVVNNGSLQFENGADIRANAIQDAVYVKDAKCFVNTKTKISAERYAINMDADKSCDVDIYTGIVNGDIRLALNVQTYNNENNYCRFGVGPDSKVTGDLIIEGIYKDSATGYHLQIEATADVSGSGWDQATLVYAN